MKNANAIQRKSYVFAWIVWAVATVVIFRVSLEALYALANILDPVVPNGVFKTWSFYIVRICVVIGSPVIAWLISYRLLFRQLNPVKMLGWMYVLGTLFTILLFLGFVSPWDWHRLKHRYPALEYDLLIVGLGFTMIAVMLMIRLLAYRAVRQTENTPL